MNEQELKALPPVTLPEVFKFIHEHFSNVRPKSVKSAFKKHSLEDIEMTVTRNKEEIPAQVVIMSDGNHEAWVCEDKSGYRNGESIELSLEEHREAEMRYYGEDRE